MKPSVTQWDDEDQIEASFRVWLQKQGWEIFPREKNTGPDVEAVDPKGGNWLFEIKGYPSRFKKSGEFKQTRIQERRMRFLYALGQTVTRIRHTIFNRYAIVFPDITFDDYYERQATELLPFLRNKLNLWFFLINSSDEVRVLAPLRKQFVEWSNRLVPKPHPLQARLHKRGKGAGTVSAED